MKQKRNWLKIIHNTHANYDSDIVSVCFKLV